MEAAPTDRRRERHEAKRSPDRRRGVEAGPARRLGRDLVARPGGAGRPPPTVALRVLRLEAGALRRDVRRRQPPAARGGSGAPRAGRPASRRSSTWSRPSSASRPRTPSATSCCSSDRCPASSRRPSPTRSRWSSTSWPASASSAAGATDPDDLDLFTAIVAGLSPSAGRERPGRRSLGAPLPARRSQMYLADVDRHPRPTRPLPERPPHDDQRCDRRDHDQADRPRRGDGDHRGREPQVRRAAAQPRRRRLDADRQPATAGTCGRWRPTSSARAAGQISPREFLRQVRAGKPVVQEIGAQYWWDGMNEIQVRERRSSPQTS